MRVLGVLITSFIVGLALAAFPAVAHGPTPKKVEESIAIAAPPDAVWGAIKEFAGIAGWNSAVASSVGRGGNEAGGERDVVLKSGGKLIDSLDEYLADQRTYSYRLKEPNIDVFPVSFYSATLSVKPDEGGGSKVTWDARFYRADTGNLPSEDKNDQAAIDAMTRFFQEGLQGLKKKLETQ